VDRATADPNIWVSGLNWYGKPHELLTLARDGKIELAISDAILDEFSRILHDKLEWSDDRLSGSRCDCDWRCSPVTAWGIPGHQDHEGSRLPLGQARDR